MQALFTGDNVIFYTDILLRAFIDLPIVVSLEARITSGDPDEIRGQIMNYLTAYIQPTVGGIPTILIPERVRSLLRENIPEVDTVKILEFRRKLGSIDAVEIISPYKNQAPIFDTVAASITVRL
jgi:hypothetical protein